MPVPSLADHKESVQLIAMGCPGSGKSFALAQMVEDVKKENRFRVTFHQELSYGDFVGAYKPVPLLVKSVANVFSSDADAQRDTSEPSASRHVRVSTGPIHERLHQSN